MWWRHFFAGDLIRFAPPPRTGVRWSDALKIEAYRVHVAGKITLEEAERIFQELDAPAKGAADVLAIKQTNNDTMMRRL